ncbi:choice-of-anchor I family protein [Microbacterium excoecariae]|uniref:choice-of-anchor I family protein n=1 Tax=Microbacterium excoecariae TaxID=2715210 RepID=UPI00140E3BF2|nr:choice-of-anchor I family protein [Microbacterium excoecariae]
MSRLPRILLASGAACALALSPVAALAAQPGDIDPIVDVADDAPFSLSVAGTFETGLFDEGASEIVQAHGDRLFSINAAAGSVSVIDMSDPAHMTELFQVESTNAVANSVAIRADGLGVVAMEDASDKTAPGSLLFFDANADAPIVLGSVQVGSLPDMVTISPEGDYAVVANEGEPSDDFTVDPEGSVGVVALPDTVAAPAQEDVETADFHAFEDAVLDDSVRDAFGPILNPELPRSTNWEPEYITVVGDTAYAALQEANAIAVVDLATATVTDVWGLGFIDRGTVPLDASDRDPEDAPEINIATYPGLYGVPMPDGISSYTAGGETYLVTANEGDAREWGDYVEPARIKDLDKPEDAPDSQGPLCEELAAYDDDAQLGRLEVSTAMGFDAERGCYSELYAYGARSFSIYTTSGELVFDSGAQFEELTARLSETTDLVFNSGHDDNEAESRSDAKGVEPENLTIGEVDGRTYAFIGFERLSGVVVYDITDPAAPTYSSYINNREFETSLGDAYEDLEDAGAGSEELAALVNSVGDLGPEGLDFIAAADSPTGIPMVAVGNEVSGTTTLYALDGATIVDPTEPGDGSDAGSDGSADAGSDGSDASDGAADGSNGSADAGSDDAGSGSGDATVTPDEADLTDDTENLIAAPGSATPGDEITIVLPEQVTGTVETFMFSTPVSLGSQQVSADSTISVTIPADAPAGTHRLAVYDADGTLVGWTTIEITGGDLLATGGEMTGTLGWGLGLAAAALIAAGILLTARTRRA